MLQTKMTTSGVIHNDFLKKRPLVRSYVHWAPGSFRGENEVKKFLILKGSGGEVFL